MNKDLTIVFSSFQSQILLNKNLKKFNKKYKIIVIENSLDRNIKKELEKKFDNTTVIIPKKNLGLAKSFNLGIQKSKTKYVFLNNPDIEISHLSIKNLIECAKKIKNFGIISPTYKNEKIYKNYHIYEPYKINSNGIFKKFNIMEVDLIDNNFLIKRNIIKTKTFDENIFLYFETADFSLNLKKEGKKIYVADKIKFHHLGSKSLPVKYDFFVKKTRSFHYNWGKFYFYKKNYNYLYALIKIYPNFIKSIKKIFISVFKLNKNLMLLSSLELLGIIASVFRFKSFYRPASKFISLQMMQNSNCNQNLGRKRQLI